MGRSSSMRKGAFGSAGRGGKSASSRAFGSSGGSVFSTSRRSGHSFVKQTGYGKDPVITKRRVLSILLVAVIAVSLATIVGVLVYQQTAKNALKPAIASEDLGAYLTSVENEDSLYWNVFVQTDSSSAEKGRGKVTHVALICIDPDNVSISFFWIPTDTRVYIDGVGYSTIMDAFEDSKEKGVIAAVAKLSGVDVSHYIEMNSAGLKRLSTLLAPLSVDVDTASEQDIARAVCRKLFGSSSEQISTRVESFLSCATTDASSEEMAKVFGDLHGMNIDSSCYQETMPSTEEQINGVDYSICNTDEWNTMISRVSSGMSPVASSAEMDINKVTRENCTVVVWNGVGVSGVANDCTNELKKLGWNVISKGNAAQFVYDETFVVFKDTDDEAAARLLAADLGQGRVVRSYARYNYTGNLLVVIGKDYKPY